MVKTMEFRGVIVFSLICIAMCAGSQLTQESVVGENVTLECPYLEDKSQVNWTSPIGEKLTHGDKILTPDNRFEVLHETGLWYLRINNVTVLDNGTYECVGNIFRSDMVELIVKEAAQERLVSNTTSPPPPPPPPTPTEDPSKCSDTKPCNNSGICENGSCSCLNNFTGSFCEMSLECDAGYCNINNTLNCTKELISGEYVNQCKCLTFYKGEQCEVHDLCQYMPCENRGICSLNYPKEGYKCDCKLIGDPNNDCKLNKIDGCSRHPPHTAKSYITCVDLIDSYKMYCRPGYTGDSCRRTEDAAQYCDRYGTGYCSNEGYCKPLCNVDVCDGTENCNFTANPFNTIGFENQTYCIGSFGDGYDHPHCNIETTLYDGFDAVMNMQEDCSPFFNTTCTKDFGNGDCKPGCDTKECLWDGYDCFSEQRPENDLVGVVIIELKGSIENPIEEIQRNISLMLRSMVNLTEEENANNLVTVLSFKIKEGVFTNILYAGKFLAAAVAKRPGWLDDVKIKDIYVCPAGMYGNKCMNICSTCNQIDEICDWKTGECLNGCQEKHYGQYCKPCDTCIDEGEVCDPMSGKCLSGCIKGHWGDTCKPCNTCKQEGDICNNATGECLYGCISNEFYTEKCKPCPQHCNGSCDNKGRCNTCADGRYGEMCNKKCDIYCQNKTCDRLTSQCDCKSFYYWSTNDDTCKRCSDGCKDMCDGTSGICQCKDGYHSDRCNLICNNNCEDRTCHVNGSCLKGCVPGFFGLTCSDACPDGCSSCARNGGLCEGKCKPGYVGSTCEKSSHSGYIDDTTDNTGIIIGVIISVLLIVLIIAVACCYWKKRQSGDYVMEDEEMEDPPQKETNVVSAHINSHMQPSSPLLGHSMDMIELDEKQNFAVYAGPSRGETEKIAPNGNGSEINSREKDNVSDRVQNEYVTLEGKADDKSDDIGKKERCTSSVVMEIGRGGRVLSVSDGDETQSPTISKEVDVAIGEERESQEDDSAFAEPPHSPLGAVRAPLASEENILASLGPKEIEDDVANKPADLDDEVNDEESHRSRSSSSSSSSSKSSKSSKEEMTEM